MKEKKICGVLLRRNGAEVKKEKVRYKWPMKRICNRYWCKIDFLIPLKKVLCSLWARMPRSLGTTFSHVPDGRDKSILVLWWLFIKNLMNHEIEDKKGKDEIGARWHFLNEILLASKISLKIYHTPFKPNTPPKELLAHFLISPMHFIYF